jgi:hypothetical protein
VPNAGLAELPPRVGFDPKDEKVFDRILIEQQGEDLFETEEDVRFLGKRLRFGYDIALDGRLRRSSVLACFQYQRTGTF